MALGAIALHAAHAALLGMLYALVNAEVIAPYMDEPFHLRQTEYCAEPSHTVILYSANSFAPCFLILNSSTLTLMDAKRDERLRMSCISSYSLGVAAEFPDERCLHRLHS